MSLFRSVTAQHIEQRQFKKNRESMKSALKAFKL